MYFAGDYMHPWGLAQLKWARNRYPSVGGKKNQRLMADR
jgi:hypothetical protein